MKRPSRFLSILAIVCVGVTAIYGAEPIPNEHNAPAVWAAIHGYTGNWGVPEQNADPDGDGLTNAEEAAAGTNPFGANDVLKVTDVTAEPGIVHLTFPTVFGKTYQPQSTTSLSSPSWTNAGSALAGNDGQVTANISDSLTVSKFYRVVVSDADSDSDGVTDWEEGKLGMDPYSPSTNGLADDLSSANSAVAASCVVTVVAADNLATEPTGTNPATDLATFTISRTGGLRPITVGFAISGPAVNGTDYNSISVPSVTLGLGVRTAKVVVTPKADAFREGSEAVILKLNEGSGYTLGSPRTAGILIADYTNNAAPDGTGVLVQYRNEATSGPSSPSNSVDSNLLFQGAVVATQQDVIFRGEWGSGSPAAGVTVNDFSSRWTGEIMPQFSQTYTFYLAANEASRMWIDGQLLIDNFPRLPSLQPAITSSTISATIELIAGKRYPIRVDHFEDQGSASVVLQWTCAALGNVVQDIPINRLFNRVPPQFAGSTDLLALVSASTFSFDLKAAFGGNATSFSIEPESLPGFGTAGAWTLNATTGVVSGVPAESLVGQYDIPVSATNTHGTGSAILHLTILKTGSALTKENWTTGAPFASLAAVPFDSAAPDSSSTVVSGLSTSADSTLKGMRLRGYITAPSTGVYQFWIGGDDDAELWISNSNEVNDLWKRATLTAATVSGSWTGAAASDLLYLKSGLNYYFEVRSRNSSGSGFVQVGWLKPGQTGTQPSEVIPVINLSPYVPPTSGAAVGALYVTTMGAQGTASTNGTGNATLQLSPDETQAIIRIAYANMTGSLTQHHIHMDSWNGKAAGLIVADLDQAGEAIEQPDGSFIWTIVDKGVWSAAEIKQALKEGAAYINLHTALYPAGELRGNFTLASGSQTFTPPPAPPVAPASATTDDEAARFLIQATYGPTTADIAAVRATTYAAWIDDQFTKAPTYHFYPYVWETRNQTNFGNGPYSGTGSQNAWWKHSITAQDQLRQKLAYALSQILVVSRDGELDTRNDTISDYFDMLLDGAFGNFRDLLENVTLHPAMGAYLDMLNNDKPDITTGRIPNENYAREIMQLFSLGLYRMWPDGSLILSSQNLPIATYDQDVIIGLAHVFTGWTFNQANNGAYLPNQTTLGASASDTVYPPTTAANGAWITPMKEVPNHHFTGQKRFLNGVVLPGLTQITKSGQTYAPPDPYVYVHQQTDVQTPEYQALPAAELDRAHDLIFNHPNVGPFVCRQLIQRFVTSTPSRDYLYRVVQKFNDNGSGVRGDLKAVIKAILLDYDARSSSAMARQGFGKQREPILRVTALGRAFAPPSTGFTGPYVQDGGFIKVSPTTPAHGLLTVGPANLVFSATGGNNAQDGLYTLYVATDTDYGDTFSVAYNDAVNDPDRNTFRTRTRDCHRGSFKEVAWSSANGGTLTIDTASGHGLSSTLVNKVYLRFRTGVNPSQAPVGGTPLDGLYQVNYVNGSRFTVTNVINPATLATPATCVDVHVVRGGYRKDSATSIRIESYTRHGLTAGQTVWANFSIINGGTQTSAGAFTVASVTDENTFVLDATGSDGSTGHVGTAIIGVQFADSEAARAVLNRSGTTAAAYSDYNMGITDTELGQSPLYSPTVFNFYLPDYQFPGKLAQSGLVTPEFQLTSETQVVRANNFIFTGFFRGSSTLFATGTSVGNADWASAGLGGFKSFNGNVGIDVSAWMGVKPGGSGSTDYWTNGTASTGNLPLLFDRLNTLLTGGQVPSGAKTTILNFVANTANIAYSGTPSEMNRRDRVRAMAHLIATSPDFTIQK